MENHKDNTKNIYAKTTKISLVVYCLICIAIFIIFMVISALKKDYSFLWGFLLCLGPGIIFVVISCLFPFEKLVKKDTSKGLIAWCSIAYVLKYLLIFCIPIIGIKFSLLFNRWSMLTITLIAPIEVIIIKLIIANYVSKLNKANEQKPEEKPKNTIKF